MTRALRAGLRATLAVAVTYGSWAEDMRDEPDRPEMAPVSEMPVRLRHASGR